jgi:hypothetical protein
VGQELVTGGGLLSRGQCTSTVGQKQAPHLCAA